MEIKIEPAKKEDARRLLDIYTPYILNTAITFEYTIPTVEEFEQRIENTLIKYPYLVAKKDDLIVGYAYTSAFKNRAAYDWDVETSVYIDMNYINIININVPGASLQHGGQQHIVFSASITPTETNS